MLKELDSLFGAGLDIRLRSHLLEGLRGV